MRAEMIGCRKEKMEKKTLDNTSFYRKVWAKNWECECKEVISDPSKRVDESSSPWLPGEQVLRKAPETAS